MVSQEQVELFKKGIANDLADALVRAAPVDKGGLRKSINAVVQGKGIFISMVDYALHVEFGTAPHIITPKNKQALHWKSGGKDVFARLVHHPGTRPQPFIRNTFRTKFGSIIRQNAMRHLT